VAAEFHRRASHEPDALLAYDRAIAHFERSIESNPDNRDTADHYIALAMAGRARLALQREDFEHAVSELVASFERKPTAAASEDGLGRTPISTARVLLTRLTELKKDELAATLEAALAKLDPELALAPSFDRERGGPSPEGGPRRRGAQSDR
jgi:tetratricopeptide (TPR) repeat protein